jgi:hypothetical protein
LIPSLPASLATFVRNHGKRAKRDEKLPNRAGKITVFASKTVILHENDEIQAIFALF